jgi:hypothetical protein
MPPAPGDPNVPKNMKVRVMPLAACSMTYEALGYIATPIPYAEVYSGIQTGIVDGQQGGPPFQAGPSATSTRSGSSTTTTLNSTGSPLTRAYGTSSRPMSRHLAGGIQRGFCIRWDQGRDRGRRLQEGPQWRVRLG